VSTTAGVSESASVLIIDLLDSPPKATSLPLDPAKAEQAVPLRKSSRRNLWPEGELCLDPLNQSLLLFLLTKMILKPNSKSIYDKFLMMMRLLSLSLCPWEDRDASIIWDDQDQWEIRSWRFYAFPAIHVLETEAGDIMYMFVDKKYPILLATIQRMPNHGLEIYR
nr:hypothetical protein [Tanacetum cinerariifolium]